MTPTVYISVDVETDGPVPFQNSLRSLGAAVAGRDTGSGFQRANPDKVTFYTEVAPLPDATPDPGTQTWLQKNCPDLCEPPSNYPPAPVATRRWHDWLTQDAIMPGWAPVFVAYPLGFDWSFSHAYLMRYIGHDPFGFGRHLDIKSLFAGKAGSAGLPTKGRMPSHLRESSYPHDHNALNDAQGQADLFANIMEWTP